VALMGEFGPGARILAGATWLMREPMTAGHYVSLARIADMHQIEIGGDRLRLGAGVSHHDLALALEGLADLKGLADAVGGAANPAIRRRATVGGNLCATDFAAADLASALLAAGAEVTLVTPGGTLRQSLATYLDWRWTGAAQNHLLREVNLPRRAGRCLTHARLPLRRAGDYPVAMVSLAANHDADGRLSNVVVAVGAVERQARRWHALENSLTGERPAKAVVVALAQANLGQFTGREGPEVPGWYRLQVLPELVGRAVAQWVVAGGQG
jgi:aerobic carbon-monoxide dehydrogenase medium subunit